MKSRRLLPLGLVAASLGLSVGCKNADVPKDVPPYPSNLTEPASRVAVPANTSVAPGETLDLFVIEDEKFNGRYTVRAKGEIILPKVGRVQVGGSSIEAAEAAVKAALEVDQLANASDILARPGVPKIEEEPEGIEEKPTVEIFVSGKVLQPGRYKISSVGTAPPSVYQSILQAGGFSRWAYPKKVYILRKGGNGILSRIDANIDAISSGEKPDVALLTGDIVVVPERKLGV